MVQQLLDIVDHSERGQWWVWARSSAGDFTAPQSVGLRLTSINPNFASGTRKRRSHVNFERVRRGDLLFGYVSTPEREIVAVFEVTESLNNAAKYKPIVFDRIDLFSPPLKWSELRALPGGVIDCEWPEFARGPLLAVKGDLISAIRAVVNRRHHVAPRHISSDIGLPKTETPDEHQLAEKRSVILSDDVALENEPGQLAEFAPQDGDERALIERQIRERRGQQSFRNDLRKRYGDRCLVTGCKVLGVLEAAHIKPYQGEKDNHPENGLLLRADIHTLFDLDLLGIEPQSLRIELHPDLAESAAYKHLASKTLRCPDKRRPSIDALKLRYKLFQERFDS